MSTQLIASIPPMVVAVVAGFVALKSNRRTVSIDAQKVDIDRFRAVDEAREKVINRLDKELTQCHDGRTEDRARMEALEETNRELRQKVQRLQTRLDKMTGRTP